MPQIGSRATPPAYGADRPSTPWSQGAGAQPQQRYADQFINKNISDAFRLRADVNAVSGATASVSSATRSIRDTAKRVAEAYLGAK